MGRILGVPDDDDDDDDEEYIGATEEDDDDLLFPRTPQRGFFTTTKPIATPLGLYMTNTATATTTTTTTSTSSTNDTSSRTWQSPLPSFTAPVSTSFRSSPLSLGSSPAIRKTPHGARTRSRPSTPSPSSSTASSPRLAMPQLWPAPQPHIPAPTQTIARSPLAKYVSRVAPSVAEYEIANSILADRWAQSMRLHGYHERIQELPCEDLDQLSQDSPSLHEQYQLEHNQQCLELSSDVAQVMSQLQQQRAGYEQSILQRLQQLQAQQEAERRAAEAAKAEAARAKAEADRKAAQAAQAAAAAAAQAAAAASAAAASPSATGGGVATPSPTTKSPSTIGGFQATPSAGAAGATRALTTAAGSPPQSSSAAAAWDPRTIYAETLAYMKERREAFAQWNHARKSQIKRLCNSSSTKISASMRQVRAISQEFCNHIESARAEGDDTLLQWAFFCLAEKLCDQAKQMADSIEYSFPLSLVALELCSQYPEVGKILQSAMFEACPLLIPYHPQNLVSSFNDQHVMALVRLYAAMVLSNKSEQYSLNGGWKWLARTLNSPSGEMAPGGVRAFFEIAGSLMQQRFGRQLHKMMMYIRDEYIPKCKPGHFLELLRNFAIEYHDGNPKVGRPPHQLSPHPGQQIPEE